MCVSRPVAMCTLHTATDIHTHTYSHTHKCMSQVREYVCALGCVCVCPCMCTRVFELSEAHTGNVSTETLVASVITGRTGPPHLSLTP